MSISQLEKALDTQKQKTEHVKNKKQLAAALVRARTQALIKTIS